MTQLACFFAFLRAREVVGAEPSLGTQQGYGHQEHRRRSAGPERRHRLGTDFRSSARASVQARCGHGKSGGQMTEHEIRVRTWVKAGEQDVRKGLLGYVSVTYGALVLDGIVLRRTAEGRFSLSFPARTDRSGKRHSYIRPADDQARQAIEADLLWQLGEMAEFQS